MIYCVVPEELAPELLPGSSPTTPTTPTCR